MSFNQSEVYRELFQSDLTYILERFSDYFPGAELIQRGKITRAFWFAAEVHQEAVRLSGEPYFSHCVATTKILLQLKPDVETICASLLHNTIKSDSVGLEKLTEEFGEEVAGFCEKVAQVSQVRYDPNYNEQEEESLRRLFMAMASDIRVVFIRLSDRIQNLRTLQHVEPEKRKRVAEESLHIYAGVAEKLGLYQFKREIEDLSFQHLNPEETTQILSQLELSVSERRAFIEQGVNELEWMLEKADVAFSRVFGRTKNIFSIHQKLRKKNYNSIDSIYDLIGVRIVLKDEADCYKVLGLVHARWNPITPRFKDYIAVPKPNGYQSIHTTVLGFADGEMPTEIQIRTEQMDIDAQFGLSAHWAYKETGGSRFEKSYLERANWFTRSLACDVSGNATEEEESARLFEEIQQSFSAGNMIVFTPAGEAKTLLVGATPVDFAYHIHSEVGHTCVGAKVNGVIKPINVELKPGDVVEILTKKGKLPNPAWMGFVKTPAAKNHLRQYLNRLKKETESELADPSVEVATPVSTGNISHKKGKGPKKPEVVDVTENQSVVIGGERRMPFRKGSCCNPYKARTIIAYKPRGLSFIIHDQLCEELVNLDDDRFMEANFLYEKVIRIVTAERTGLFRDISTVLADENLNVVSSGFEYNDTRESATWNIGVEVTNEDELAAVLRKIKKIPNVMEVGLA